MDKKLTVVVPIYNTEEYLCECLDSIKNQTYTNLEVLCIEGSSTDNSLQIIEEFVQKDSRFKLIKSEHLEISDIRNIGLDSATGDYITFVDSDDFIEPETYTQALKQINYADFVCFKIKVFGSNLYKNRKSEDKYYNFKFRGLKKLDNNILKNLDVSLCNKIFKTSLIKENNITFPNGMYYEDANFFWKYMLNSKTGFFIQKYFYNYRRHENSIMTTTFSKTSKALDHLLILGDLFEYLNKKGLLDKNLELCTYLLEYYFRFVMRLIPKDSYDKVFEVVFDYANFLKTHGFVNKFIQSIIEKNYEKVLWFNYNFIENIFSIKNDVTKEYKVITILGLRCKIRRKKICQKYLL